ncbi:hypothetical protein [Stomatohabitans albus]|uniref:hypothetical protein n=1 Tax=Stomatohabitans albus TaxID=3110766 RepID=UPI00300D8132
MQWDDHASREAYFRTPQGDSLRDIMRDVLAMEQAAGVRARRRLGLSLAAYLLLREQGDKAQWGSEWNESQTQGPQGWLPASMCNQSLFESLASQGAMGVHRQQ